MPCKVGGMFLAFARDRVKWTTKQREAKEKEGMVPYHTYRVVNRNLGTLTTK